jgi:hypothetical protein
MLLRRSLFIAFASLTALAASAACSESPSDVSEGTHAGGDGGNAQSGAGAGGEQTSGGAASGGTNTGAGGDSSGGDEAQSAGAAGAGGADDSGAGGSSACNVEVAEQALAVGTHVDTCSEIEHATNPPSSGPHYPVWADFGVYDFALPRGFWVHNLEHGAVVVTYNCPDGCADELTAASAWLAELGPDANCPSNAPARVLLVPDPELDVRWAASSWGFTLRADCFDAAAFSDFYVDHAGQPPAPEYFVCGTGSDLRADDAETCGANDP